MAKIKNERASTVQPEEIALQKDKVFRKIAQWRESLLDLSKKNRLLFFSSSKTSTVHINAPSAQDCFRRLIDDGASLAFPYPKAQKVTSRPENSTIENSQPDEPEYVPGDCEVDGTVEELQRKLGRLKRDYNTFREEQGVHALYLAYGMLHWREAEHAEMENLSPIVLIPVLIDRKGRESPFSLRFSDEEEVEINPALIYKLTSTFGVNVPGLPPEHTWDDIEGVLQKLGELIPNGWEITRDLWLGRFSFEKFVMYMDLESHREAALQHPIISGLAGISSRLPPSEYPSEERLDDEVNPAEVFPICDADSSQMQVVVGARAGCNMVVQGPPGTGKSQTIVNIIAQALREKKKVLFVSEKMAALNVVFQRLKERGLAFACLEVHSHRSNKAKVAEELGRSLDQTIVTGTRGDNSHRYERLKHRRNELNSYVRELHKKRGAVDKTAFEAFGFCASLERYPEVNCDLPVDQALQVSHEQREIWLRALGKIVPLSGVVDNYSRHPWKGLNVDLASFTSEERDRIFAVVTGIRNALERIQGESERLEDSLGIHRPSSLGDLDRVIRVLDILAEGVSIPARWIAKTVDDLLADVAVVTEAKEHALSLTRSEEETGKYFGSEIFTLPVNDWLVKFKINYGSMFRIFKKQYRMDRAALSKYSAQPRSFGYAQALAGLDLASRAVEERKWFQEHRAKLQEGFPESFYELRTDWDALLVSLKWLVRLKAEYKDALPSQLVREILDGDRLVGLSAETCNKLRPLHGTIVDALGKLTHVFELPWLVKTDSSKMSLSDISDWLSEKTSLSDLDEYVVFLRAKAECERVGLSSFIESSLADDLPANFYVKSFEQRFWKRWISECQKETSILREFNGQQHEHIAEEFRSIDRVLRDITRDLICIELMNSGPRGIAARSADSELGKLRREIVKKRRHLPLRRLFAEIPALLQKLKPCLLMSPLSVASYLKQGKYSFDLVIFDEASQVLPADAIGAILRGKQLIVIGDRKQLPPTRFFQVAVDADGDEEAEDESLLESILDECSALSDFDQKYLRWHYRSRHEELIAFSNREFYEGRLITFPSPYPKGGSGALVFEHVKGAIYDRGKSKTNRVEAKRVIDLVVKHVQGGERGSVGVIALSLAQEEALWTELDERKLLDQGLDALLSSESEYEPFFIKALEKVQGDERDFIFISVGYGHDDKGVLHMNFGPINQVGGERRLNVAVTRARIRTSIVSSILPQELDLTRLTTKNKGVISFQRYLEYAHKGGEFSEESLGTDYAENDFELSIKDALEERGYKVDCQIGSSGFRIDLGVRHPDNLQRYLVGIECDGATYHSHKTARDRDRLRQEVLEKLGWRILRIWSTDWFRDSEAVLERTVQQIIALRSLPDVGIVVSSDDAEKDSTERVQSPLPIVREEAPVLREVGFVEYINYVPGIIKPIENIYRAERSRRYREELGVDIMKIVNVEGPIHKSLLCDRLGQVYSYGRTGARIVAIVERTISDLQRVQKVALSEGGAFIWHRVVQKVEPRRPKDGEKSRPVEFVPLAEISQAASSILGTEGRMPRNSLVKVLASAFGYERLGGNVETRMDAGLELLLEEGKAVESEEQVRLNSH